MAKKRKYDWEKMGKDYERGLSCTDLNKKYGVSATQASVIIKKLGIKAHSKGYKREVEWRKIVRTGNRRAGLLVSIPKHFIRTVGFDPEDDLLGKWIAQDGGLLLSLKTNKSQPQSSNQKSI